MVSLGIISAVSLVFFYKSKNKKRAAEVANGITLSHDELADMGDRAPTYQYVL